MLHHRAVELRGIIFVEKSKALEWFGRKRLSTKFIERVEHALTMEVEIYSQYKNGEVYGYIISDGGNDEDSCWGFYGLDYCVKQAKEAAEFKKVA